MIEEGTDMTEYHDMIEEETDAEKDFFLKIGIHGAKVYIKTSPA